MGDGMNWRTNVYASYINLDHRKDRYNHMQGQLGKSRLGLEVRVVRQRAIHIKDVITEPKHQTMFNRTPGAIGCWLSQVEVMRRALAENLHALVMEDDLVFCSDFIERLDYIFNWLEGREWDVFWLGGTVHSPAFWHPKGPSGMRPDVSAHLGYDMQPTSDPRIIRTYGAFSTHAYIVNRDSTNKVVSLLDKHMHESIGIDHCFIRLQPQLKTYMFVPGCVKQIDNMSDIGNGMTIFSGFSKLNGTIENSMYWWQDKMADFDPTTFQWK